MIRVAACLLGCLVQLVSNTKINLSQPLSPQLGCNQDNHSTHDYNQLFFFSDIVSNYSEACMQQLYIHSKPHQWLSVTWVLTQHHHSLWPFPTTATNAVWRDKVTLHIVQLPDSQSQCWEPTSPHIHGFNVEGCIVPQCIQDIVYMDALFRNACMQGIVYMNALFRNACMQGIVYIGFGTNKKGVHIGNSRHEHTRALPR